MKPLDRRGFSTATLGCVLAIALMVAIAYVNPTWLSDVFLHADRVDRAITANTLLLFAGGSVFGLWAWFSVRRFSTLVISRWPAMLPFVLWIAGFAVLGYVVDWAVDGFQRTGSTPIIVDGSDGAESPGRRYVSFEEFQRDLAVQKYLAIVGLALAALAFVASAWVALRGLRRDPVPVEDVFS